MPAQFDELAFEIEHVIAKQHGGGDELENRAAACFACNRHKGPNISGIDPKSGSKVWLFNPRRHKWERHFRCMDPCLLVEHAWGAQPLPCWQSICRIASATGRNF